MPCTVERFALACVTIAGSDAGAMDQAELTAMNVELGEVTPLVEAYSVLTRLRAEAAELEALAAGADEPDMRKLASEELQALLQQVQLAIMRVILNPTP